MLCRWFFTPVAFVLIAVMFGLRWPECASAEGNDGNSRWWSEGGVDPMVGTNFESRSHQMLRLEKKGRLKKIKLMLGGWFVARVKLRCVL